MTGTPLLLHVVDVHAGYGKISVLHGVNARVEEREIVCIIGPNGSGKSTLLKTIFGLLKPSRGTVMFRDRDITGTAPEDMAFLGITFIPQGRNIFPSLTVRENLELGMAAEKDRWRVKRAVEDTLSRHPALLRRADIKAVNLSGGEKQILALSRAALMGPSLILLDEPSIGLSPRMIEEVYGEIRALNERGITFAIVEQNACKALGIADRGYVLDLGETRLEDTGEGLLRNEEVKKLYLGG